MFRFFRRNQKFIIVVGGVILMFVFLIGDSLQGWIGDSESAPRESPNATFVSWSGGKLTNAEYAAEFDKRKILNGFIRNVVGMGRQKAMERGIEEPMLPVLPLGTLPDSNEVESIRAQVVTVRMLADMAKERGIRVSREALQEYIAKLGFGELSSSDLTGLLSISARTNVSGDYILDALEDEFLAKMMLGLYGLESEAFLSAEMPFDRWETWRYLNDLVSVEAAALKVEDFRVDVKPPTDEQLKTLYEEYKEIVPHTVTVGGVEFPSPNPAFAVPRKIKLQYLHVNYDDSIERIKAKVTDEEIKQYYEANKGLFTKADALDLFDIPDDDSAEIPAETPAGEGETPPADPTEVPEAEMPEESPEATPAQPDDPAGEPAEEEGTPSEEAPASDEEAPAGEAPTEEPAEPATTEPAETEPAETEPDVSEESPPDEAASDQPEVTDGSASRRASVVEFVSFQTEEDEPATEEPPATDDQPATEETPGEESSAETSTDEATSEESSQPEETPADEAPASPQASEGEPPTEASELPADPTTSDAPETSLPAGEESPAGENEKKTEYQPLEEVADDIKRRIAEDRFAAQVDEKMASVMSRLRASARDYRREIFNAEELKEPLPKPPADLADLAKIAEEFDLAYEETVELDMFEMIKTDVGSARDVDDFLPIRNLMFSDRLGLYQPIEAQSFGGGKFGDRYIVMKTSDTPGRVPPFDEVKSVVREAWIKREAAKIALKRAEEYAAKAQEAGQSLQDFFDGNERVEVVETNSFSRYTQGEAAAPGSSPSYKLSQPIELEHVGPKFMETVFNLSEDEAGAALNVNESIAYVVRIANPIETEESLQGSFLASANGWDGRLAFRQAAAQGRMQSIQTELMEQFDIKFADDEESADEEAE